MPILLQWLHATREVPAASALSTPTMHLKFDDGWTPSARSMIHHLAVDVHGSWRHQYFDGVHGRSVHRHKQMMLLYHPRNCWDHLACGTKLFRSM